MKLSVYIATIALTMTGSSFVACGESDSAYVDKRLRMVEEQIKARGIKDRRVLGAMSKVKRHLFVPDKVRAYAYNDYALPIEADQTISQPYIVALMTEALQLDGGEKILEVGTGSGYQAAILGELASEVYTIEIVSSLAESAGNLLESLGYDNITVREGDGYKGWQDKAPFDAIIVTCAPAEIPPPLLEQLAEGGRLVIPVGENWQELLLIKKINGVLRQTQLAPVQFVPMTGEAKDSN